MKVRISLLENPALTTEIKNSVILSFLLGNPEKDPWYTNAVNNESDSVKHAVDERNFLHFSAKNPGKKLRSTRPIAKLMALCSDQPIDPTDIAKNSLSTDWLIRAGIARNKGTPPNILNKMTGDANPVVASLANANPSRVP